LEVWGSPGFNKWGGGKREKLKAGSGIGVGPRDAMFAQVGEIERQ